MSTKNELKRYAIYKRDRKRCVYCGRGLFLKEMTLDHIIPRAGGGSDHISNLACSCAACNTAKGSMTLQEFVLNIKPMEEENEQKTTVLC